MKRPKSKLLKEKCSRRDFFRLAGRVGLLAGTALLAYKIWPGRAGVTRQSCVNRGICRDCPQARDCELPAALSVRQAGSRP